jgi:hypothetical protein
MAVAENILHRKKGKDFNCELSLRGRRSSNQATPHSKNLAEV